MKEYPYEKYKSSKIRVIIDTDCACEGDDAFAVAQALLTAKFDVRAILAANYLNMPGSVEKSFAAVEKLLEAMDLKDQVKVLHGSMPMQSPDDYENSEAVDFIIEEAMREDDRPLFFICQCAITNLAAALRKKPEIADRLTCVWIGGGAYPRGGYEFNLCNDITAARIVLESSVPLWQVPQNVYSMMQVSYSVLYERLGGCGKAGRYLLDQLMDFARDMQNKFEGHPTGEGLAGPWIPFGPRPGEPESWCGFATGEIWSLGDSPAVGLLMNAQPYNRTMVGAPLINDDGTYTLQPENPRKIAVYHSIEAGVILEDLFAKMKYQYGSAPEYT